MSIFNKIGLYNIKSTNVNLVTYKKNGNSLFLKNINEIKNNSLSTKNNTNYCVRKKNSSNQSNFSLGISKLSRSTSGISKKNYRSSVNANLNKVARSNLRELVNKSVVISDSGANARINFANTTRFNGVETETTLSEKSELLKDKAQVMKGDVSPLIGKGIISTKVVDSKLPIECDYVRFDKESEQLTNNILDIAYGLEVYSGKNIQSAEIILGTPIGNYYNKQEFSDNLKCIQLDNGNCGTVGFRFNLSQLKPEQPLLIHSGELSGCTMVFGIKDEHFYALHSGQPGNNKSEWETEIDGSKSIIDSHKKMTGSSTKTDGQINNQVLTDYLHENFEYSIMTFCGHGENVNSQKNVISFDYNKSSTLISKNEVRVANAIVVLTNDNGVIKMSSLSDDIAIDKNSLKTKSLSHAMSGSKEILVLKSNTKL
ncbi:MAG TPA: hypothetical protein DD649_17455 [Providencia sp.]|uniref:cytotoxic necrotizing factor Rho-activating domain-containing protein n=1 Tax=Providencia sp. TaxID=589 RepID=UPI000E809EE4|nr:cytotoxic necrotizing factor Rho-activating domain-containing protein [Providencia sp.]HBO24651.1 hypothetical protein [Providencia sp.]